LSVAAAYGNERLPLHVFIPKNGSPLFQPVVEYPSSTAVISADSSTPRPTEYLIKSGKVVILPIYKGTYGRREGMTSTWPSETHKHSEFLIKQVKDFRRAVDYAFSHPEFSSERLAYFGTSWGGRMGAIIPAVEKRVKVAVLVSGGLPAGRAFPEVDPLNFVTRVTIPVLMINGRQDPIQHLHTAQLPMFRLFGSPPAQKRHVIFETGHGPYPRSPLIKEVLGWMDRYPERKDPGLFPPDSANRNR
jgi:eukaryotic-like serine/threonine-protein kinase